MVQLKTEECPEKKRTTPDDPSTITHTTDVLEPVADILKDKQHHDKESEPILDHQKKIDAILDKISKSGYDSLTKEEKDYLFRAGKE